MYYNNFGIYEHKDNFKGCRPISMQNRGKSVIANTEEAVERGHIRIELNFQLRKILLFLTFKREILKRKAISTLAYVIDQHKVTRLNGFRCIEKIALYI